MSNGSSDLDSQLSSAALDVITTAVTSVADSPEQNLPGEHHPDDPVALPSDSAAVESSAVESDSPVHNSMEEFYALQRELYVVTIGLTGGLFLGVWGFYSLQTALSYFVGGCVGLVYLRLLAKNVERLGKQGNRLSRSRLALLVGLIVVASQWQELQVFPIILGFLTYKLTLLVYILRITLAS